MATVIDSHQHFWKIGMQGFDQAFLFDDIRKAICRDYLPNDLEKEITKTPVRKTVFVQTQHNLVENDWVLSLADQHDFIAGVVGWVDLASPNCEKQLLRLKEHPKFVGVRHITHDEPDDDFIIREDVLRGLRTLEKHGVPFKLLFFPRHLHHAATLARRFPDLPLVINHLSNPSIESGAMEGWIENFRAAAEFSNVYCKLSGMATRANWTNWSAEDLQPYVDVALQSFGPERLMFGSDWPVSELAGSYEQIYAALDLTIQSLSTPEREMILGGTAQQFYSLSP